MRGNIKNILRKKIVKRNPKGSFYLMEWSGFSNGIEKTLEEIAKKEKCTPQNISHFIMDKISTIKLHYNPSDFLKDCD